MHISPAGPRNLLGASKGRYHKRMHVFFRALPELAKKPPPPPPNSGNFVIFFSGRQNDVLRVWQKKIPLIIIMVFNDNYISNDGNFDDNDDKKHTNIISFE